jgi:hypothetical protein
MEWYQPIQDWGHRKTTISYNGYVLVWVPEHPKSFGGGWYYEHVLVAEKIMNRILRKDETVHHIDEDKTNNISFNLFVCCRRQHNKAHRLSA